MGEGVIEGLGVTITVGDGLLIGIGLDEIIGDGEVVGDVVGFGEFEGMDETLGEDDGVDDIFRELDGVAEGVGERNGLELGLGEYIGLDAGYIICGMIFCGIGGSPRTEDTLFTTLILALRILFIIDDMRDEPRAGSAPGIASGGTDESAGKTVKYLLLLFPVFGSVILTE